MIPIFDDDNNRMPIVYGDLRLNEPINGNKLHIYEVNAVLVRDVFSGTVEPRPAGDGSEVYGTRKSAKLVRLDGIMRAPSLAALSDMGIELRGYLDPAYLSKLDVTGHGFAPLEFDVLSVAGNDESYVLARPVQNPDYMMDQYLGKNMPFRIEFLCADPRRYLLTANLYTLTGTDTEAVTQQGNYPSIPAIEITMSASGSSDFRLINHALSHDPWIGFNLSSLSGGDDLVIWPNDKIVTVNGDRADSIVNQWDTDGFLIYPGTHNIEALNANNAVTEITVYHTFSM